MPPGRVNTLRLCLAQRFLELIHIAVVTPSVPISVRLVLYCELL